MRGSLSLRGFGVKVDRCITLISVHMITRKNPIVTCTRLNNKSQFFSPSSQHVGASREQLVFFCSIFYFLLNFVSTQKLNKKYLLPQLIGCR